MDRYLKPSDFLMEDEAENPFNKSNTNLKKEQPNTKKDEGNNNVKPKPKIKSEPKKNELKTEPKTEVKTKVKKVIVKDKNLNDKVDKLSTSVENNYKKIVNNMEKMIDVFTKRMDLLQKDVDIVREPTNEEKFEAKINSGKPFNLKLSDYFSDKVEKESDKPKEYIAKVSDIKNEPFDMGTEDELGLKFNYYTRNNYNF